MGSRLLVCLLLVAGCAPPGPQQQVRVDPYREVGRTHKPYEGNPIYLAANRPLYAERRSADAATDSCQRRSAGCDARLRAELVSLDGQLLALSEPPTETQMRALSLTAGNLTPLLAPYPDLMEEQRELVRHIAELPTLPRVRQSEVRRRMLDLSDLLRVQLAASD